MARTTKAARLTQAAMSGFQSAVDDLQEAARLHDVAADKALAVHDEHIVKAADALEEADTQTNAARAARERAMALAGLLHL